MSVAETVSRTPRLIGQAWKALLPVAILGVVLKQFVVWAAFDIGHFVIVGMPATYPAWSLTDAAREFVLQFFDLVTGAALVWIAYAALKGGKRRAAFGRVALSLPALAVTALVLAFAWEIVVTLVKAPNGVVTNRTLALIALGVLVWTAGFAFLNARLWVIVPAIVIERQGPVAALRRSWTLTAGHATKIFLVAVILVGATRLPRLALPVFSGASQMAAAHAPFTLYGAVEILLEAVGCMATAACVVAVFAGLSGIEDEIALDAFT